MCIASKVRLRQSSATNFNATRCWCNRKRTHTHTQGNCDAEGRLILADALFEAASARPDLVIDAATLTVRCGVCL